MATRAFGIDFATLTASVIVIVACCDRVVLLVSKKTIQAFGGGGAGGGSRNDMFCVDSPHAVTRRASPNRAERLLNILASKGCCAHCTWTLRNAHQAIRRPGHCGRPRALQPAVLGSSPVSPWKGLPPPGTTTLSRLHIVPVLPGERFVSSVLRLISGPRAGSRFTATFPPAHAERGPGGPRSEDHEADGTPAVRIMKRRATRLSASCPSRRPGRHRRRASSPRWCSAPSG